MRNSFLLLITFLVIIRPALLSASAGETNEKKWGIAPFPVVAYQPETSLILGAGSVIYFKPEKSEAKTDSLQLAAFYTLKNQFKIAAVSNTYLSDDFIYLKAVTSVARFPTDFYGIGPDTSKSAKENYTPFTIPFEGSFFLRIAGGLYAGPSYGFYYEKILKSEKDGIIDSGITGSGEYISSGLGASLVLDTRDSGINAHSGLYAESKIIRYSKSLGSDTGFTNSSIDLRGYFPVYSTTLGVQLVGKTAYGDIPFQLYPSLGGGDIVRGFLYGRYIDKNLVAAQIEYRFPVYGILGMTIFAGAGDVEPDIDDLGNHIRYAAGAGLRMMIDKDEKINIRGDVTYNGNDVYTYVDILEAF